MDLMHAHCSPIFQNRIAQQHHLSKSIYIVVSLMASIDVKNIEESLFIITITGLCNIMYIYKGKRTLRSAWLLNFRFWSSSPGFHLCGSPYFADPRLTKTASELYWSLKGCKPGCIASGCSCIITNPCHLSFIIPLTHSGHRTNTMSWTPAPQARVPPLSALAPRCPRGKGASCVPSDPAEGTVRWRWVLAVGSPGHVQVQAQQGMKP